VREAMREALAAEPLRSEVQALRHHLLSLACDADVVLDLHCDDRAILHLYADPAWQAEAGVAAFFGIETVLLSQESGGYSFDEACGLPWHRLARAFRNGSTASRLYGGDRGAARSAGCESRAGP
jgi:predicted deacylase